MTVWIFAACQLLQQSAADTVPAADFNRDIRPILSDNCFRCHGPDAEHRMADLRLDDPASAVSSQNGSAAVVPGNAEQSELFRRITSDDPDIVMPPPHTGQQLSVGQIDILRRWIQHGAPFETHWSLVPPRRIAAPDVAAQSWVRNEIDSFIAARLEQSGLQPSAQAAPELLLRRAALDLTGLPPEPSELDRFLNDADPHAWEHAVNRLLASPHFGERMAMDWLDAARYADTHGYFGDRVRSLWPWRDWVIEAFNRNMPFDQFTITQLAGDLLPEPSNADLTATGFNRNHMANNETGLIDEEYRVEYVADRLETTATTWLGLTVGCTRCHDHKYDPLSQKDYYQLFAFFNNSPDKGLITDDNPLPRLELPSAEQQQALQQTESAISHADQQWAAARQQLQPQLMQWEQSMLQQSAPVFPEPPTLHVDFDGRVPGQAVGTTIEFPTGISGKAARFDATQHVEITSGAFDLDAAWTLGIWANASSSLGCLLSIIEPTDRRRGVEVLWQKGRYRINLVHHWGVDSLSIVTRHPVSSSQWHHLICSYDGTGSAAGLAVYIDGQPAAVDIQQDSLSGTVLTGEPLRIGRRDSGLGFYGDLDELQIRIGHVCSPQQAESWFWSERLSGILSRPTEQRATADADLLLDYFVERFAEPEVRASRQWQMQLRQQAAELRTAIPVTLIIQELPEPRTTTVLIRGEYDRPGDEVAPGVPQSLSDWPDDAPFNRLGFARWLTADNHPLTARVAVNRLWQQCFGEGLVRSVNDFGSQGEMPSHPELLDWLALRLIDSGWDIKAMLKLIVTSATYQQSSAADEERRTSDPENRLLARSSRFRLSAEMIRDQALAASGLLVRRVGGPSVKPYQPPGLWEEVSYNGEETYQEDSGEGLWRRSLYTFIKRQAPPPSLITFDGPTREKCTVRRTRTNTPLQALVTLNDTAWMEAARCLAAHTLRDCPEENDRISILFRRVTCRHPEADERRVLEVLLRQQQLRFSKHTIAAEQLISTGASAPAADLNASELAAWTVLAHTLLNLDEVMNRP